MKYRSLDVSYWYFLTLIIFIANVSLSFAKKPSYACFKLAHGVQEQKYDIYIDDKLELRRETEDGDGDYYYNQHAGTGWTIPKAPFKIMDKSGKNGVEITAKVHPVTIKLSRRCACVLGACFSRCDLFHKYNFGYFITARAIGKGLNITGCSNASSVNGIHRRLEDSYIYGRFETRDDKRLLYTGYGRCCILNIDS